MSSELGKKIKAEILNRGMSISAFERKAGLNRGAVWAIISNKSKNPKRSTIELISNELNCTIEELLSEKPIEKKITNTPEQVEHWDSKFFMKCVSEVDSMFLDLKIKANADKVLKAAETLYDYSKKLGSIDKDLVKFIVSKFKTIV